MIELYTVFRRPIFSIAELKRINASCLGIEIELYISELTNRIAKTIFIKHNYTSAKRELAKLSLNGIDGKRCCRSDVLKLLADEIRDEDERSNPK